MGVSGPLLYYKAVVDITAMFRERTLLVPHYMEDKEMKKALYHDMVQDDI